MEKPKVLIADYVHPKLISGLSALGFDTTYAPDIDKALTYEILPSYEGVIINTKTPMQAEALGRAKQLKFIGRLGSGLDIIDLPLAMEKDIHVINSPEGNCNAVAEHAMAMLLCLANNVIRGNSEVKDFQWNREKNRGFELADKKIGIIGFGHTGSAFAGKFANWLTSVLVYDKYKEHYAAESRFIEESTLEKVQAQSDIISLHLPLTAETHHMVNTDFLKKCKTGVILINTSRGKVIDENALIEGLESGQIAGACLDVFENEKPAQMTEDEKVKYQKLYKFEQVICTPHVAGWTHESKRKIAETLLEKIAKLS